MPEILHLNLHREFFDAIAAQAEAHRTASNHTGASGWKIENMTRSCSATAMRRTHRMLVEFRGLRRYGRGRATMKLPRRKFLRLAGGAAALPAVSRFAWAQAYPSRPVRIIVG
jgi:hypothetical protein